MRFRIPRHIVAWILASGAATAACGSEETFEPQLATNQRLLATSATASLAKDDETLDQLTVVGDLDGDGVDDAIVRTVYYIDGALPDNRIEVDGGVYVVYGGAGLTGDLDLASLPQLTGAGGDGGGLNVAAVGDVDGDGLADVLVSAERTMLCAGNIDDERYPTGAYLVYGSRTRVAGQVPIGSVSTFLRDTHPCSIVTTVTGLGDVDGDGTPDFAVARAGLHAGEPNEALIYYGRGTRLPASVPLVGTADASFSWLGDAVAPPIAPVGDVDGDGRADFLIGDAIPFLADLHLIRGSATRLAGAVTAATQSQTTFAAGDCLLSSRFATALGDLDGDGADDFALVGCGVSLRPGEEHANDRIYYGRRTGFPAQLGAADAEATIPLTGDGRGNVAAADLDGDGLRDLIVGDPALGQQDGGVHLVLGDGTRLTGTVDLATRLTYVGGPKRGTNCDFVGSPDCVFHERVGGDIGVGDLTGDHRPDLFVVAGSDSFGVKPLGVHGSSMDRAYVLAPFSTNP